MLKYLRFATYSLFVAALWVAGRFVHVIPVSLDSPNSLAADAAQKANKAFTEDADVFSCQRSGKEVLSIAEKTLAKHNRQGCCAYVPRVKLRLREKRVYWVLSYDWPDAPPGSPYGFDIVVDDVTGKASIE